MSNTITEVLFREESYPSDLEIAGNLGEVIGWLEGLYEKIPEQYRDVATIEIDRNDYESSQIEVTVSYERPMTEAEIASRDAERAEQERMRAARDLAIQYQTYVALKAKFES